MPSTSRRSDATRLTPSVNCLDRHGRTCAAGYGGGRPAGSFCETCVNRREARPGRAVYYVLVPRDRSARASSYQGAHEWAALEIVALAYRGDRAGFRAYVDALRARLPCGECRRHFGEWIQRRPPTLKNRYSAFR